MSLKSIIALFVFVCSPGVYADEVPVERPPIIVTNMSDEILRLEFRDGGRNWQQSETEQSAINLSFSIWKQCFDNPNSRPDCNSCNDVNIPEGVRVVTDITRNRCLPAPADMKIAYSTFLSDEMKIERDAAICECYRGRNGGGLADFAFDLSFSADKKGDREEQKRMLRCMHSTQIAERLVTERLGVQFSAASYSNNQNTAVVLSGIYGNLSGLSRAGAAAAAGIGISRGIASSQHSADGAVNRPVCGSNVDIQQTALESARARDLSLEDFTSERLIRERNFCLPYRHFLASKQFPDNQDFYESLNTEEFVWKDWNYTHLIQELRGKAGSRPISSLQNNPSAEVRQKFARAKFLFDNPAIKNLFMARSESNRPTKARLFEILKEIPRPVCNASGCRRDSRWNSRAAAFRARMDVFLRDQPARDATRDGLDSGRAQNMQLGKSVSRAALVTSDRLIQEQESAPASPRDWRFFCDSRDFQQQSRNSPEIQFEINFEDFVGARDFENPENDREFVAMNNHLCSEARRGRSGVKSFQSYFTETCGTSTEGRCSVANRPILLGQFLKDFPDSTEHDDSLQIQAIAPFLGGGIAEMGGVTANSVQLANTISGNASLSRSSISEIESSLGIPQELRSSSVEVPFERGRESGVTQVAEATSSQTSAQAQVQNQAAQLAAFNQVADPLIIPQAQAAAVSAQPEASRSPASQNDEATSRLREEISSLREALAKPANEGGPRDSFEIETLRKRLAQLERERSEISSSQSKKKRKDRNNNDDDSEGSASQDDDEEEERAPSRTAQNRREQSSPIISAPVAATTSGVQSGSVNGGASAPSAASSAAVTGGGVASAVNAVLPAGKGISRVAASENLSRFGVQETVEQNGITVAVTSSNTDFQSLRSSSENSVINETISPEEFNQIAGNNQSALQRFLDQAKAMPGEVVRLNLKANNRMMEIFVVKNGNEISIVQAPEETQRRLPARTIERENTLEGLNNEFQVQR